MITKLVQGVFNKAQIDSEKDGPTALSKYVHEELLNRFNINLSKRNLLRYYNSFVNFSEKQPSIQEQARDGLAKYLGYSDYSEFVAKNSDSNNNKRQNNIFQIGANPMNINTFNGNIEIN